MSESSAHDLEQMIAEWADRTFGKPTLAGTAARSNKEMAELLYAIATGQSNDKIIEEAADVFIVLCRLKTLTGRSLVTAVQDKMRVNRARKWKLDGHGHGQHVPDQ